MNAIEDYKHSEKFNEAVEAEIYFQAKNSGIVNRPKWKMRKSGKEIYFSKNIAISNFFNVFVTQENQHLLVNGLQTKDQTQKNKLGKGFDTTLRRMGGKSLVHGASWGYWNYDHLDKFDIASINKLNGFFPLPDEMDGKPRAGIKFYQIDSERPIGIEFYEMDGVTKFKNQGKDSSLIVMENKTPYKITTQRDAISERISNTGDYGGIFPIIPLYADEYQRSRLNDGIKSKINLYDIILSDFGDNLDRTNLIYWVFKNFGGDADALMEVVAEIEEYGVVAPQDEGEAEPRTIEVPYEARETALKILRKELFSDAMALDTDTIKGGSLTTTAIKAAITNLNMKVNEFEGQVFDFCQQIFELAGVETEDIKFERQTIVDEKERMEMVQMCRDDLDHRTALMKNPLVEMDEIDDILERYALEQLGIPAEDEKLDIEDNAAMGGGSQRN